MVKDDKKITLSQDFCLSQDTADRKDLRAASIFVCQPTSVEVSLVKTCSYRIISCFVVITGRQKDFSVTPSSINRQLSHSASTFFVKKSNLSIKEIYKSSVSILLFSRTINSCLELTFSQRSWLNTLNRLFPMNLSA